MSFLSKNWAGLLVCLIISIISWVLGGFLPVVGAPVFAIFIGMILYPFLTPYKQLDAGLTYSSKKLLQYAVILLGFGLNISQVFAVGKSSLPVILSTISIALIIAFFPHIHSVRTFNVFITQLHRYCSGTFRIYLFAAFNNSNFFSSSCHIIFL